MSSNLFLQLDKIEGECEDEKHPKWIEIVGWSHGAEMPATNRRTSTGPSVERCNHNPIGFSKPIDKASMALMSHLWAGKEIAKGKIECFRADKENVPIDYLVIEMEGLFIASLGISGGEGDIPQEEYTMTYGVIQYKYKGQLHLFGGADTMVPSKKVNLLEGKMD